MSHFYNAKVLYHKKNFLGSRKSILAKIFPKNIRCLQFFKDISGKIVYNSVEIRQGGWAKARPLAARIYSEVFPLNRINRKIDEFSYRHPNFGIPNLMKIIVIGTALVYLLYLLTNYSYDAISFLSFNLSAVLHGTTSSRKL